VNLRQAASLGGRAALASFGLPDQPSLSSIGISLPKAPGIPKAGPVSSRTSSLDPGTPAAKTAFNVGMGASGSTDGAGASPGEPTDIGRRQRSVIDRAFQRNEDDHATSSMPAPGGIVSP
jgi:hypothetical protein